MSTPSDVNASSVHLWCYGIKKWRFDRDRYRITALDCARFVLRGHVAGSLAAHAGLRGHPQLTQKRQLQPHQSHHCLGRRPFGVAYLDGDDGQAGERVLIVVSEKFWRSQRDLFVEVIALVFRQM
jgi:hypothetical protein